jgi:hypothetical protein
MSIQLGSCAQTNQKVILLVPALESRNYLLDTLASLGENITCFDKIILSVNGFSTDNVKIAASKYGLLADPASTVLCTNRLMTAVEHLRFIQSKLRRVATAQDLIFLLADDDLLPADFDLTGYINVVRSGAGAYLGMGNFSTFESVHDLPMEQAQHVGPGELIKPVEFLLRNQSGHLFTNMSSMLIPFAVFDKATSFMVFWGSSGRRFEYILATHSNLTSLYSPPSCSALIRQHPTQEGRTLSKESGLYDELIYILWTWLNQPATRPSLPGSIYKAFSLVSFLKIFVKLFLIKCRHCMLSILGLLNINK